MISDGDRILVGLSGGKDSLTLMWMLAERLPRIPLNYELVAVHVDLGFPGGFTESLKNYCENNGYHLTVVYTNYGLVSHSLENRENPCFLCARMRRKRLFEMAAKTGCNKIALGHNKDDIIETLLINMCYGGEISTMMPAQEIFGGELTIIRPLAFTDEATIRNFAESAKFPIFKNPCPTAPTSKRNDVKKILESLYRGNTKVKGNIFRAIHNVRYDYMPK
ncbi:MAG: tRNA 2-thiocytidine biosynthesis protein TtcA [Desulfobacteraceae bacterium]|nr:tRNA 2-thiocytidine biosynthesis protein TtcA [Desulfobacteraceae bacterium]